MKPFIFEKWHTWRGTECILLSDENTKQLRSFKTSDDVINWLFVNDEKPAARALNSHIKLHTRPPGKLFSPFECQSIAKGAGDAKN